MTLSNIPRVLSASLLALALPLAACASNSETPKGGDSKDAPAKGADSNPADASGADGAIAGKPVEGEGKPAVAAGDGGSADASKEYTLQIDPAAAKVGEESKVSIKVVPQGTWHMNLDYPTKLEVVAPAGTTVAKPKLAKGDAVKLAEDGCEFAVAFTPTDAGAKKFTGEFKFAVCQDDACVPKTETLEFEVAVE